MPQPRRRPGSPSPGVYDLPVADYHADPVRAGRCPHRGRTPPQGAGAVPATNARTRAAQAGLGLRHTARTSRSSAPAPRSCPAVPRPAHEGLQGGRGRGPRRDASRSSRRTGRRAGDGPSAPPAPAGVAAAPPRHGTPSRPSCGGTRTTGDHARAPPRLAAQPATDATFLVDYKTASKSAEPEAFAKQAHQLRPPPAGRLVRTGVLEPGRAKAFSFVLIGQEKDAAVPGHRGPDRRRFARRRPRAERTRPRPTPSARSGRVAGLRGRRRDPPARDAPLARAPLSAGRPPPVSDETAAQHRGRSGRSSPARVPLPAPAVGAAQAVSQATSIEQSRAIAQVQAMMIAAKQYPRDEGRARARMQDACGLMSLAERAFYRYPRGGEQVEGPSIHLARELARCWGTSRPRSSSSPAARTSRRCSRSPGTSRPTPGRATPS